MAEPVLTVNVVTPDGTVYNDQSALVICKTTGGEVGIMPNHIPLLASLAIDEIRVKKGEDQFDEIAVSGGFCEFSDNTLTVLASAAERKEDIDVSRAEQAKKRAEEAIAAAKQKHDDVAMRRAEVSLRRAINRLNIKKN